MIKAPRFIAMGLVLALFGPLAQCQSWISGPAVPTGGSPRTHGAAVVQGANLYLLGGTPFDAGGDGAAQVLTAGSWSPTSATEGSFLHLGAGIDSLGRIVVFGGEDANGDPGEVYWWTPQDGNNGGLQDRSSQAAAKLFATATDAQGRIYALGGGAGQFPTTSNPNTTRCERYLAATDTWEVIAPLPVPVADAAACFDGQGHILVLGGFGASGTRRADVLSFDTASGSWSQLAVPNLPAPRSGLRAVLGADGRIYAIGGSDGTEQATTFILDLNTMSWSTGPALSLARQHFGAALQPNGDIFVIGGVTATGGTATCEILFTPTCPVITTAPASQSSYLGSSLGLAVEAAGTAPFSYQWRHDGIPLQNGPTAGGQTVVGADTASLGILQLSATDAGAYDCIVSNACGATTSSAATITLVDPATVPPLFNVHLLHPAGALSSKANATSGGLTVGSVGYTHPTYGTLSRAMLWSSTSAASSTDITPPNSVGGDCLTVANGVVAGWWWWPYTNQFGTGYYRHASVWTNGGTTHFNVQSSGWEIGSIADTDGTHHVGSQRFDENSTNSHAFYWPTQTTTGARKLTPAGAWGSGATALDGGFQWGSVHIGFGVVHAARWDGISTTHTDINPPSATRSYVVGAGGGQQVGSATFAGTTTAGYWSGSAASFQSLDAPGVSVSLYDCEGGVQVGTATTASGSHAALWTGTPGSLVDLHAFLPSDFGSSTALGIDVAADGSIAIAGSGYNTTTQRTEAILWRSAELYLNQDQSQISASAGGSVNFDIHGGASLAGRGWFFGGSVSGTSPGLPIGNLTIPLNPDFYLSYLATSPAPWIMPVSGVLDANGSATASGTIAPGFLNLSTSLGFHHAFVVLSADGTLVEAVSNALPLTIVP